ncbi:uncharacterized protein LOC125947842 [Anopheles darlingi]|uniref:uncharacterized protein LOC125947842 n=1 Tax=Anopheles darlingi TaxID=43151 RepID=UPI0021000182|nr:uncharacterized protein LOC125947842 [Anopheles darlingi]
MFLVVHTVNDNGEKEWKVAPKRWVCTTKNTHRTVLLWPHEISSERQKQLARSGSSKPMKSWSRKECIVQQDCSTYDAAKAVMIELMAQRLPSNSGQPSKQLPCTNSNRMRHNPKIHLKPTGVSDVVSSEPPVKQPVPESKASMLNSIKTMVESLIKKQARIEEQNARIEKQNADIEEQNARIKKQKSDLLEKLSLIQKRCANRGFQHFDSGDKPMKYASFDFDPVETIEQLNDLENKLNDEVFRSKMVTWLKFNVVGTQPKKRMSSCLNLLISPDLLVYCTWTGIVRNGRKQLAIKDMKHILDLFQEIGTTPWEKVNDTMVATFFKGKAKNALQRFHSNCKSESHKTTMNSRDVPQEPFDHADSSISTDHMYTESIDDDSETQMEVEILH